MDKYSQAISDIADCLVKGFIINEVDPDRIGACLVDDYSLLEDLTDAIAHRMETQNG